MTASFAAAPLIIQRRLAIRLLHEAQVAAPAAIDGVVTQRDGEAESYLPRAKAMSGEAWARVFSNPAAPAIPTADELAQGPLTLMISLDTKGVLELRAWVTHEGAPLERVIAIRD